MQALRFALRNLWRDLKSGELSVLLLALMIAVLSLTAVGFFISRVSAGVSAQASEVLAADLRLESFATDSAEILQRLPQTQRACRPRKSCRFPPRYSTATKISLVAFNAVSKGYPLRGRCARSPRRHLCRAHETDRIPNPGEVWVDGRAMARLQLDLGAAIHIGAATFRITQVLDYRPDQGGGYVNLAPSVLINYADLAATQLIQPGSRVNYYALFAGRTAAVADFRDYLKDAKMPSERIDDVAGSSRQLSAAIDRATRFLNLASLAAVLLAAIAVAMGARRYASRHIDTVALMKCRGASQSFVLWVSLVELSLLAVFRGADRLRTGVCRTTGSGMAAAKNLIRGASARRLIGAPCRSHWSRWPRC